MWSDGTIHHGLPSTLHGVKHCPVPDAPAVVISCDRSVAWGQEGNMGLDVSARLEVGPTCQSHQNKVLSLNSAVCVGMGSGTCFCKCLGFCFIELTNVSSQGCKCNAKMDSIANYATLD